MVKPLVSKDMVHTIGSPVLRAPRIAASTSAKDDMVSIQRAACKTLSDSGRRKTA